MVPLKLGMVGGGQGAFIGGVHRMASRLDGCFDLVAGAFASDPERAHASAAELGVSAERSYADYQTMATAEAARADGIEVVSIVTPNHVHYAPAKMALENGFHVVCDKPLCFSMEEAEDLVRLVNETGLIFALTHNYTGYPMVKQARAMVKNGDLGEVRKVIVEYPQGWLSTKLEDTDQKQAAWRTDPKRSGIAGAMGDIGTHAENLAEYITGLKIKEICADLTAFVDGRLLDDDGNVLLRFENGAKGILHASQIAAGEENDLNIRVYGTKGGFHWFQMQPNSLHMKWLDKPQQVLRTGVGELYEESLSHTRIPAGHPEGYLEAFANIYRNFAFCVQARLKGEVPNPLYTDFPTVEDGLRGMQFIEKVVASSNSDLKWYPF